MAVCQHVRIVDAGRGLKRGGLLNRLDEVFLAVYREGAPSAEGERITPRPLGVSVLAVLLAATWGLLFLRS